MKELLEDLARLLVDDADAVCVEAVDQGDATLFRLHVADKDKGKVIGRQGRVARALRALVRAAGARSERRFVLEIVD